MGTTQDQQILITRIFDAPRDVVFAVWTEPEHVAAWFGPEQFDTPRDKVEIDLRLGGRYALTMVRRDSGAEFPVVYEIAELDPPRLLVLKSPPMPEVGIHQGTITRVEFHDHGDKTRMTMSDGPYTETAHAEGGWQQAFAKIDALLRTL